MIIPTKKSWLWLGADRQIPICRIVYNLRVDKNHYNAYFADLATQAVINAK